MNYQWLSGACAGKVSHAKYNATRFLFLLHPFSSFLSCIPAFLFLLLTPSCLSCVYLKHLSKGTWWQLNQSAEGGGVLLCGTNLQMAGEASPLWPRLRCWCVEQKGKAVYTLRMEKEISLRHFPQRVYSLFFLSQPNGSNFCDCPAGCCHWAHRRSSDFSVMTITSDWEVIGRKRVFCLTALFPGQQKAFFLQQS